MKDRGLKMWAEPRTKNREDSRFPFREANELGEMFSPLAGAHFSRVEDDFRPPFLLSPRERANSPIRSRGEINSLAHTPKIK